MEHDLALTPPLGARVLTIGDAQDSHQLDVETFLAENALVVSDPQRGQIQRIGRARDDDPLSNERFNPGMLR